MSVEYAIFCDGVAIADLATKGCEYYNATFKEAVNNAGSLEFTLSAKNPFHDLIHPMRSVIDLYRGTELIWRGRVISAVPDIYGNQKYTCEGALAFLNDECVEFGSEIYVSAKSAFETMVSRHNSDCDEWKRFKIGNVSPEFENLTVSYAKSEGSRDMLQNPFYYLKYTIQDAGGIIYVSFDEFRNSVINYVLSGRQAKQPLVFQKNIIDISRKFDTTEVATKVRVVAGDGYSVTAENDAAIAVFGNIERRFDAQGISDHIGNKNKLQQLANQYLEQYSYGNSTVSLTAIDLGILDANIESFRVGDLVRVLSYTHGINTVMQLTEMTTNLNNPSASRITLGGTTKSLTKFVTR